jgi:hypothetical protein
MNNMRKVYTDKLYQTKDDVDIQLIDGKIFEWQLKSECIKFGKTLNEFFDEKFIYLQNRKVNIYGFVFYDVSSHKLHNQDEFGMIVTYAYLIE